MKSKKTDTVQSMDNNDLMNILNKPSDPLAKAKSTTSVTEIKAKESIGRETVLGAAQKFGEMIQTFVNDCEADLVEQTEVIGHLKNEVFNTPKVKGFYVESLVSAMKVKAETNASRIKALDAIAKLITAGKGELFIKHTNTVHDDITKLLEND